MTVHFIAGKLIESPGSMLMTDDEDMGCNVAPENIAESKCFISGSFKDTFFSLYEKGGLHNHPR